MSRVGALLAILCVACGPSSSPPDASTPDAAVDSCGERAERGCPSSGACEAGVCRAADLTPLLDREAVRVECGAPAGALGSGERCEASSDCASGMCAVSGYCVDPCGPAGDCEANERCDEVQVRGAGLNTHPTSACLVELSLPPRVEVRRQAVSVIEPGRLSCPMQGQEALFIVQERCAHPLRVSALDVAGQRVFDAEAGVSLNPLARSYSPFSFWVPSGDWRSEISPARLVLQTDSDSSYSYEVTELTSEMEGVLLDLDIFYVSLPGVEAQGERGPERVRLALEEVERTFLPAGIQIGDVRQHEVDGMLGDEYTIVDFDEPGVSVELPELFRLSAGIAAPSVPVFLVRSVDFALGLAGGIPGPLGMAGTSGSGIVLSYGVLDTPRELGQAMAHELAHFLGLFHTTESAGSVREGFVDTPECPAEADTDGDGFFSSEECAGAGAENLMFWSPGGEQLSASQAELLRRAPILRAGVMGG